MDFRDKAMLTAEERTKSLERRRVEDRDRNNDEPSGCARLPYAFFVKVNSVYARLHWLRFSLMFLIFYPVAWVLCLFVPLLVVIRLGGRDLADDFNGIFPGTYMPWSFFIAAVLNALAVILIDRSTIPRLVDSLSSQATEAINKPEAPGSSTESNQEELARRKPAKGGPNASAVKDMTLGGRVRVVLIGLVFVFIGLLAVFFGRTITGLTMVIGGLFVACLGLFYILRDRS